MTETREEGIERLIQVAIDQGLPRYIENGAALARMASILRADREAQERHRVAA